MSTFAEEVAEYGKNYKRDLLEDTLPFWLKHGIDTEDGGYHICLGEEGNPINPDRPMWAHGRFAWLLATLYTTVRQDDEWLKQAKHGIDFIQKYGFDKDGRMFYSITKDGKPLRKRRYIFTETFGVIALAAYGKAAGDEQAKKQAKDLFALLQNHLATPGMLEPKVNPETRQLKGLAIPMITLVTCQELRLNLGDDSYNSVIDSCIEEIKRDFVKDEFKAVLECVAPDGSFVNTFEGRAINPGHAIEAGWFILHETKLRYGFDKKPEWTELGLKIIDYSLEQGWDEEYGGIINLKDAKGYETTEYWADQKFWWPQCEALIATLLAYQATKDMKYWNWHKKIHAWAYKHFPDKKNGEWYGYLARDGRVSTKLKGNMWKGPFHIPRAQLVCSQLCEEISG